MTVGQQSALGADITGIQAHGVIRTFAQRRQARIGLDIAVTVVTVKHIATAAEVDVQLPGRWAISTETRQAIKAIPGVVHVEWV